MKSVVQLTHSAQQQIEQILADNPNKLLRLGVNSKGCSGHSYTFDLIEDHELHPLDSVIHTGVVVCNRSMLRLIGSTLNWQVTKFGAHFEYNNPAVTHTCGCGTSVGFAS